MNQIGKTILHFQRYAHAILEQCSVIFIICALRVVCVCVQVCVFTVAVYLLLANQA